VNAVASPCADRYADRYAERMSAPVRQCRHAAALLLWLATFPLDAAPQAETAKLAFSGRAIASDGAAADFADVLIGCGDVSCSADEHGRFRCPIKVAPENESVCVEHPRLGRARIDVEGRRGEIDLGDVRLQFGATIRVTRPPHLELPDGAEVALLLDGKTLHAPKPISHGLDFNGLGAGDYVVLLTGREPQQRREFPVRADGVAISELFLELEPFRLTGDVALGKTPLKAILTLYAENWNAELKTDAEGQFGAEMWESGTYAVTVESGAFRQPYSLLQTASPAESHWRITIPSRRIVGRVVDGDSREPIAQAAATLQSDSGGTTATRTLDIDADGNFEIVGVANGRYTLAAQAGGYVAGDPLVLDVREFDGDQRVELPLYRGKQIRLSVTNPQGVPIADAAVLTDFANAPLQSRIRRTDAQGALTLDLRKGEEQLVFVLPREGSMAMARVRSDAAEGGVRVVVPAGTATLRLEARTTGDEPLPGAGFYMRRDGVDIPLGVWANFVAMRGARLVTDAAGSLILPSLPPGEYELGWRPPEKRVMAGRWIRVTLVPGETVVTQTFAEAR
jgi:hypothetical protein